MTTDTLIEKELDELYKIADDGVTKGAFYSNIRRWIAYILKFIAAGGSLVIATGLWPTAHQLIGVAILIAVFIDTVSSNHKKLIAQVEAGYAFRALKSRVKWHFNREASSLFALANDGEQAAIAKLDELMKQAHIELSKGIEEIRNKLERVDIEALKSLSLDQERNAK